MVDCYFRTCCLHATSFRATKGLMLHLNLNVPNYKQKSRYFCFSAASVTHQLPAGLPWQFMQTLMFHRGQILDPLDWKCSVFNIVNQQHISWSKYPDMPQLHISALEMQSTNDSLQKPIQTARVSYVTNLRNQSCQLAWSVPLTWHYLETSCILKKSCLHT